MRAALGAIAALAVALAPVAATASSKKVVLVPLSSVGSDASSADLTNLSRALAEEIARIGDITVLSRSTVSRALDRAKRQALLSCDGAVECLVELGTVAGASAVIYGEVGGLGDAQVVYLKLVLVQQAKVLRSTTLEVAGKDVDPLSIKAAAIRLLAPDRYTGSLATQIDVAGASIYVDGEKVGESPASPVPLLVGSHALRITHPEFRDFIRFIDVEFGGTVSITAELQQFPIVSSQIRKNPEDPAGAVIPSTRARRVDDTPWYREWYGVAGIGAAALVTSAVVFSLLSGGIDADSRRPVDVP